MAHTKAEERILTAGTRFQAIPAHGTFIDNKSGSQAISTHLPYQVPGTGKQVMLQGKTQLSINKAGKVHSTRVDT